MMTQQNVVVAIYKSHTEAEVAVKELQQSGFDMKKLSIVARDQPVDEHVIGYYNAVDRMKCWAKMGMFWGMLFGSAFSLVPGAGLLLVAGPLPKRQPLRRKTLKTFKELTDKQLETAIKTAATCFETWRHTSFAGAGGRGRKSRRHHARAVDEFARPVTLEMGKLIAEARGEVALSADIIDYYAKNAERFLAPQHLKPSSGEAEVESSPFGVLFGVQPWNFPYYQLARFAAPNLMAGNVVMVKHAGCVPQCAIAFEKLWLEAGAPAGAYTNLLISHDQVNRVIDDPRIKGVALTGGVEAGKSVAARADKTSRSPRWNWAAATPSSCSRTPTSTRRSSGRSGPR
jgi:hypothetical protein